MEMQYRPEEYACMRSIQVPYQAIKNDFQYEISIEFKNPEPLHLSENFKAKMLFALKEDGTVGVKHKGQTEADNYIVKIEENEVESEQNDELIKKKLEFTMTFNDISIYDNFINEKSDITSLSEKFMKLKIGKLIPGDKYLISFQLIRRTDGEFFYNGQVKQEAITVREMDEKKNEIRINLNKLGVSLERSFFNYKNKYRIEMKIKSEKLSKLEHRMQFTKTLSNKLEL